MERGPSYDRQALYLVLSSSPLMSSLSSLSSVEVLCCRHLLLMPLRFPFSQAESQIGGEASANKCLPASVSVVVTAEDFGSSWDTAQAVFATMLVVQIGGPGFGDHKEIGYLEVQAESWEA